MEPINKEWLQMMMMEQSMKEHLTTTAAKEGTVPLTMEHLVDTVKRFKRETGHFLVIEANYLPDDCYGVIYLRPEDARRLKASKAPSLASARTGGSEEP